ncbi:hypothetical protein CRM22_002513 [Opisthorchis felineus]|uniref:Uncharacterized protein n=1 Tax=Opisthorchis felineus TaxID=147828 RepID=A0A4S2M5Q0_OPIFE|nr:hypothetical protein CRM22_002513 [Opisthorchis felineus]
MALTTNCHPNYHHRPGSQFDWISRMLKIAYRFYIPDKSDCMKPFTKSTDRRLQRIVNNTECVVSISQSPVLHRGQQMRRVLIKGASRTSVECCVHQIEESFPQFYALAPLQRSLDELRRPILCDVRRHVTMENIDSSNPTEQVYYKLQFFILSGYHEAYEKWKQGRIARIIDRMDCHLVVSQKDHPDIGFTRRYAVILGPRRQDVMQAYNLFYTSFVAKFQ